MIRRRQAFTLIELLVVIAIIGVLIGLLLPAVQKVREAANRTKCQNTLKQLALACFAYESSEGAFPPGDAANTSAFSSGGGNGASWLFTILPYMEQPGLYNQVRTSGSFSNAFAAGILPQMLPFTRCPSDPFDPTNALLCNYVG